MDTPDTPRRETGRRLGALGAVAFLLLIGLEGIGNGILATVGRLNLVIALGALGACFAVARRRGQHPTASDREPPRTERQELTR